jgi:hypothetical protein
VSQIIDVSFAMIRSGSPKCKTNSSKTARVLARRKQSEKGVVEDVLRHDSKRPGLRSFLCFYSVQIGKHLWVYPGNGSFFVVQDEELPARNPNLMIFSKQPGRDGGAARRVWRARSPDHDVSNELGLRASPCPARDGFGPRGSSGRFR